MPPQNLDAEESVLGGVLLENEAIDRVEFLREEDFYREKHRKLFAAMRALSERSEPVDVVTLASELKAREQFDAVGGETFLVYLAGRVPTAANIAYYGKIVQEKSLLRSLIGASTEIAASGYQADAAVEELLDRAETRILEISEHRLRGNFLPIREVVKETFRQIERLHDRHEDITGVPTGFSDLDRLLGGLQPTDLIILAARPSMGKTSLALNVGQHVGIHAKMPVAIFSLEMAKEQLAMRMLSSEARIDSAQMRRGFLGENAIQKLIDAASALSGTSIYIDDTPSITPLELRAKARRIKRLHREEMGLVIVDYLQLMQSPRSSENRAQEVSDISRSLKALAKELGWPVLALSQLNRAVEQRTDKRPILADLRESGAIEQDADVVGFIFRESVYDPNAADPTKSELIIAKNRNGPTSRIELAFLRQYTTFADYSHADYGEGAAEGGDQGGAGGEMAF